MNLAPSQEKVAGECESVKRNTQTLKFKTNPMLSASITNVYRLTLGADLKDYLYIFAACIPKINTRNWRIPDHSENIHKAVEFVIITNRIRTRDFRNALLHILKAA
jgi:hypothetical protein